MTMKFITVLLLVCTYLLLILVAFKISWNHRRYIDDCELFLDELERNEWDKEKPRKQRARKISGFDVNALNAASIEQMHSKQEGKASD